MQGMKDAMALLVLDPTNSVQLYEGMMAGVAITAAAQPASGGYQIAYAVCSTHEVDVSPTRGIALAVHRLLQDKEHPQQFRIGLYKKGGISPQRMAALIRIHIEMDAVTGRVRFPAWFVKDVTKPQLGVMGMCPMPENYYLERIAPDKTPVGNYLRKAYRKARKAIQHAKENRNSVQ